MYSNPSRVFKKSTKNDVYKDKNFQPNPIVAEEITCSLIAHLYTSTLFSLQRIVIQYKCYVYTSRLFSAFTFAFVKFTCYSKCTSANSTVPVHL